MKVVVFHNQPVPPLDYGGTERVCAWLCQGLLELGHSVTLLAPESGPGARAMGSPGWQKALGGIRVLSWTRGEDSLERLKALIPPDAEVLHSMVPLPEDLERELVHARGVPVVTTIHGNGKPGERFSDWAVFVSRDHARRHGSARFVWNGLDPAEFTFRPRGGRNGFAFLSKTSWKVKNLRGAMRVCARAGVPLSIAGGDRPLGLRLETLLRPGWRWLGRVAGDAKAEHLASARALVFPVLWPEPFGLVVAEALFSGTPVLATPVGSLPELVPASVGKLIQWQGDRASESDWVELLREVQGGRMGWEPEACLEHATRHFHYRSMTESYLEIYQACGAAASGHRAGGRP
jgi:glycosyltransferase involved in cell wall biosynthesis